MNKRKQNNDLECLLDNVPRQDVPTQELDLIKSKLRKLADLEEKIANGFLVEQGKLPGTYNGYICGFCSSGKAKWKCKTCKLFFCLDHIRGECQNICKDCRPRCASCYKTKDANKEPIVLKKCSTCNDELCYKCDADFHANLEPSSCSGCVE